MTMDERIKVLLDSLRFYPDFFRIPEEDMEKARTVLFELVEACAQVAEQAERNGLEDGSAAIRRELGEQ